MKGCKKLVANMGAIAIFSFVTGCGIIYIDVFGNRKPCFEDSILLFMK